MEAAEQFRAGRLSDAIRIQTETVKGNPTDVDARYALLAYLCFAGELERASAALRVIIGQRPDLGDTCLTCQTLLNAEAERHEVLRERGDPVTPSDAPEHLNARLRALHALRGGDAAAARKLLDEADEATPIVAGSLNGQPFRAIRDYDDLLGGVLEIMAGGSYAWVPLERVRVLTLSEPSSPLDLIWAPAELLDVDGVKSSVYIPALYAGSHEHADEAVQLGRRTEWLDQGEIYRGAGQRVLLAAGPDDETEADLLSVRRLEID